MLEGRMIRGKNIFKSANIFVGNTEYITWKENGTIFSIDGQKIISAKIFDEVRTFLTSLLNKGLVTEINEREIGLNAMG